MADIELVIKISNYDKEWITNGYCIPEEINTRIAESIANGTPLPKGHGRLIDADTTLKKHCVDFCREKPSCYEDCGIYDLFHLAPTIIEADKESEE